MQIGRESGAFSEYDYMDLFGGFLAPEHRTEGMNAALTEAKFLFRGGQYRHPSSEHSMSEFSQQFSLFANQYFNWDCRNWVFTATTGNRGALTGLINLLTDQDGLIAVEMPSWRGYSQLLSALRKKVHYVPLKKRDLKGLKSTLEHEAAHPSALILSVPHNPSGTVDCYQDLIEIAEYLSETDGVLILDLAFVGTRHAPKLLDNIPFCENAVLLFSFSKSLLQPALRLGAMACSQSMTARLRRGFFELGLYPADAAQHFGLAQLKVLTNHRHFEIHRRLDAVYQKRLIDLRTALPIVEFERASSGIFISTRRSNASICSSDDSKASTLAKWAGDHLANPNAPLKINAAASSDTWERFLEALEK